MTNALIMLGTIALIVSIVGVLDLVSRRRDRQARS
jgi:hypothetical protein